MSTVTIQEAQAKLPDLIHNLSPGNAVVITDHDQPVARLVGELPRPKTGLARARSRQGTHYHPLGR